MDQAGQDWYVLPFFRSKCSSPQQNVSQVTFQSWKEDVVEERMIKKMEMMSAQTDAAFKKTMMKLGAEQEDVLLQTTFSPRLAAVTIACFS